MSSGTHMYTINAHMGPGDFTQLISSVCIVCVLIDNGNKEEFVKGKFIQQSEDLETLQSSEVLLGPAEKVNLFKVMSSQPGDREPSRGEVA